MLAALKKFFGSRREEPKRPPASVGRIEKELPAGQHWPHVSAKAIGGDRVTAIQIPKIESSTKEQPPAQPVPAQSVARDQLKPTEPIADIAQARALALCKQWGWHQPPEEVIKEAKATVLLRKRYTEDVMVGMGLVKPEDVEQAKATKPANVSIFDHLAQIDDSLYAMRQKVMAVQEGLQYFDDLDSPHIKLHELFSEQDIVKECDNFGAVLIKIQEKADVIVFTDRETAYRRWVQLSGAELDACKLRHKGINFICAIGRRDQIMAKIKAASTHTDEDEASVQILYESRLNEGTTVMKKIASIHELAIAAGATDIHIDPDPLGELKLMMRVYGSCEPINETLNSAQYHEMKSFLLKQSGAQLKYERIESPLDGNYQYAGKSGRTMNVRCSFMPLGHQSGGSKDLISVSLRLLPMERGEVNLKQKNIFEQVIKDIDNAVQPSQGLILLAGPTGSGKSTTIAGMIGRYRSFFGDSKKILSLEDPIERLVPGVIQIQIPHKYRKTGDGFSVYVRNFLRHDPDSVWLGEIRDKETAENSVNLASTGHLVFSTVHSESPVKAVNRMVTMLPPEKPDLKTALIESLSLVVGQRLVKKVCKHCGVMQAPTEEDQVFMEYLRNQRGINVSLPEKVRVPNLEGCDECRSGYTGVTPINEVLVMSKTVKETYLSGDQQAIRNLNETLSVKFEESAIRLIQQGVADTSALKF